jgi:hypothetical protein
MNGLHEAIETLRPKNAHDNSMSRCRHLIRSKEKVLTAIFVLPIVTLPILGMCSSLDTHVHALAVYAQNTPPSTANAPPPADEETSDGPTVKRVLTTFEFWLSLEVLLFGVIVAMLEYVILRARNVSAEETLRVYAVTLIIVGTLFAITAGFDSNQIAPAMGLFGTIAGYVLGRRSIPSKQGDKT